MDRDECVFVRWRDAETPAPAGTRYLARSEDVRIEVLNSGFLNLTITDLFYIKDFSEARNQLTDKLTRDSFSMIIRYPFRRIFTPHPVVVSAFQEPSWWSIRGRMKNFEMYRIPLLSPAKKPDELLPLPEVNNG